ncbi:hypothetical protein SS209_00705 [Salmonella enterica subsp. enterica serovar Senftenberg str. SS209]|nr:hypothetical protein SS209_00705 [Salmonella enterica subsp. enterica serovar Senftenberg str. SS209]
MDIPESIK